MSTIKCRLIAFASILSLVVAVSCAGDAAPGTRPDSSTKYDKGTPKDTGNPWVDSYVPPKDQGVPKADQYQWPDTGGGQTDTWQWPTDTYTGAPFGCQIDADCFGKLCCPTPWGVKVCAETCGPTP